MAKDQNPVQKPKISKLPLPATDSPLVIDLPDGQKIVIGKMNNGSVIEVATWRGVGRPDSRTSRLMLGVGNGSSEESSDGEANTSQNVVPKPQGAALILFYFVSALQSIKRNVLKLFLVVTGLFRKRFRNSLIGSKKINLDATIQNESTPSTYAIDPDVQDWLDRISKSASERTKKAALKQSKNEPKKGKSKAKPRNTSRKSK